MKKSILAFGLLAMPMLASAGQFAFYGSVGRPVLEDRPDHLYQCTSDGYSLRANAAAGFGRCKAIFPLAVPGVGGVVRVRAVHSSPDTTSNITMTVGKMIYGGGGQWLKTVSWYGHGPSYAHLNADMAQPLNDGESLFVEIEVRGDTEINAVNFETVDE